MVCNNAKKEDYKSEDYLADKRRAEKFMYSFNYKKEFDRVIAELLRNGQCYSWFRTNYGGLYRDWETDRKSTRLNSSHSAKSRMPSSA